MNPISRRTALVAAAVLMSAMTLAACNDDSSSAGDSDNYPTKGIRLVVPYAAGGPADLTGRQVAAFASEKFGQPVTVENIEGGSGITGALQVVQAKPDGYTLFVDSQATGPALFAFLDDIPFKLDERTYISELAEQYPFFIASKQSGFTDLKDAMDAAKSDPSTFAWAGSAVGSTAEISTLQLFQAAGVPLKETREVTFQGGMADSAAAIASGQVAFGAVGEAQAVQLAAADKVTILGVAAPERGDRTPDVPTAIEQGYDGVEVVLFQALAGPPGLPDDVIKAWRDVLAEAVDDPDMQQKASDNGATLTDDRDGPTMATYVQDTYQDFFELAKASGKR